MAGRIRTQSEIDRFYKTSPLPVEPAVYFFQAGENGPIKIGYASNIRHRLENIQTGNHEEIRVLGWICPATKNMEREIHGRIKEHRIRGEWYRPTSEVLVLVRWRCASIEK
jgi:hypothetical protein